MRLLSSRLETAEGLLDRRLEIAKQRRAEVGFVKDILSSSNRTSHILTPHTPIPFPLAREGAVIITIVRPKLINIVSPLPSKAANLHQSLLALHTQIAPLDYTPSSSPAAHAALPGSGHTKAWEMGRQAYLNWAVGKMVSSTGASGSGGETGAGGVGERMEGLGEEMSGMGGGQGMEKLARAVGA